jgi:hypothetical protein
LQGASKSLKDEKFAIDNTPPSILGAIQPAFIKMNKLQATGLKWIDTIKTYVEKMVSGHLKV